MSDIPGVRVDDRLHSRVLEAPLAAPRRGIMHHYDDSSRDDWVVEWFQDPRCTNGYTWPMLDDGRVVELADPDMRTPHAGPCLTPNANSAYYGITAAANGVVLATAPQLASITDIAVAIMRHRTWDADPSSDTAAARIVGHDAQAIWTPAYTPRRERWGKLGRKVDPTGQRRDGQPIIDLGALGDQVVLSSRANARDLPSRHL